MDTRGTISAVNGTVAAFVADGTLACAIAIQGTFAATFLFEYSLDSTDGANGQWYPVQGIRSNANTIELTTGALTNTPGYGWEVTVGAYRWFRVKCTAYTSGTATVIIACTSGAIETVPGLTSAVTSTPATPSANILNSAATTNGTVVKASAGSIYSIMASNLSASPRFLKLHNSASVTVGSTAVNAVIVLPATSHVVLDFGAQGMRFGTGICLSITGAVGDADTTAIGASEVKVITNYI
jgi:hypothetical protein